VSGQAVRVSRDWLALREPADAAARARDLAALVARRRPTGGGWQIHDVGGGTGAMGRWLAPLLPGAQHWVIHDRDEDLLELAAADPPGPAADGAAVTVETRRADIVRLDPGDLAGATLITASALLDMLTAPELGELVRLCHGPRCPVLFALSVVGRVELAPTEPLDGRVAGAFNAHQRRVSERGALLGPDAVAFAADAFARRGAEVRVRDSPWHIGPQQRELATAWFTGWVAAAREQEPAVAAEADGYVRRRLGQLAAGEVTISVGHADLLALPTPTPTPTPGQPASKREESA
jgi:hypothetical protein